jgi:hypothetical protein
MDFARLEHVDLQPREMGYHYHSIGIWPKQVGFTSKHGISPTKRPGRFQPQSSGFQGQVMPNKSVDWSGNMVPDKGWDSLAANICHWTSQLVPI